MIKKPSTRHKKNEPIKIQSVRFSFALLSIVTTIKMRRGPHAHHSPHIAAGEATLDASLDYSNVINNIPIKIEPEDINANASPIK